MYIGLYWVKWNREKGKRPGWMGVMLAMSFLSFKMSKNRIQKFKGKF